MGGGGPRLEPPRLSRAHLEPGRPSGDPVQAERGPGGLSRLDLRQSPPRREPLGTAEGMACYCHPLRENRLQFHGRPLPCRHARLAQAITGPNVRKAVMPCTACELPCRAFWKRHRSPRTLVDPPTPRARAPLLGCLSASVGLPKEHLELRPEHE